MNQSLLVKPGWRIIQNDPEVFCLGPNYYLEALNEELVMVLIFYFGLIVGWKMLVVVLPWHLVLKVVTIHAGFRHSSTNKMIWGWSRQGLFSVKSTYEKTMRNADPLWHWRFTWKLKMPLRVQNFLWTLLYDKLLTNKQRTVRDFCEDDCGPRCQCGPEDTNHCLRRCRIYGVEVQQGFLSELLHP
ncbi:hypothetical protein ACOSQ3_021057 [Xanthoceras sorbifolium]